MSAASSDSSSSPVPRHFATTQWSLVVAAADVRRPDARQALTQLCQTYWYPVYAFVRARVNDRHQAQDQTQAFFVHLLEQQVIARAEQSRGRFRAFLRTALQNFLANEWAKARAEKRGGGQTPWSLDFDAGESRYHLEPTHDRTPERIYERQWVLTLLDGVLTALREEMAAAGKAEQFEQLKGALTGTPAEQDYEPAAAALGISLAAAKQAAYRLRKRYRQLVREEVAQTVSDESEIDDEIGRLLEILAE